MTRIAIGFLAGLAIGAIALALIRQSDSAKYSADIAREKVLTAKKADEIEELRKKTQQLTQQFSDEVTCTEELKKKLADSAEERNALNDKIALLEEQVQQLKEKQVQPPQEPEETQAQKDKPNSDEELAKIQQEAMERYARIQKVGQPLSDEAIKELEIDEAAAGRVNAILKDESGRVTKALAEFCRQNVPDMPEDVSGMTSQALIGSMATELIKGMSVLGQLSKEDRIKISKGEKDLLDFLPRDSTAIRLAHTLYQVRQETYSQLERELTPEKTDIFKDRYLPPNDFVFTGNLNLLFGNIDWEKER